MSNEQRMENLVLRNVEKYVVCGDLVIEKYFDVENSTIYVSGALILTDECIIHRCKGCDILTGSIQFGTTENAKELKSLYAPDTDIFTQHFSSNLIVITDGIIDITKDLKASTLISCRELFVGGRTDAKTIQIMQDAYFGNNCSCYLLSARDVFVDGQLNLNGYPICNFGDRYVRDGIINEGHTSD